MDKRLMATMATAARGWLPDGREVAMGAPLGVVVGALVYVFGGWDDLIRTLLVLVILDLIFGVALAWVERRLASHDLAKGLIKKSGYFAAVALAVAADRVFPDVSVAGVPLALRTLLIWALLGAEMLSVAENLALAGVPLPPWFVERLKKLNQTQQEGGQQ